MKVYLASWFASLHEIQTRANELRAQGIEVTSRWLEEKVAPTTAITDVSAEYLRDTAMVDIHDILLADTLVLNTPSPEDLKRTDMSISTWARGGRHFEAGFQYATMVFFNLLPKRIQDRGPRRLVLVGHRENVFHYLDIAGLNGFADSLSLPAIPCYPTWDEAKKFLVMQSENELVAAK